MGNAFRMEDNDGVKKLFFYITIPKEHMPPLVNAIRLDPNAVVEINAYLNSFTFEVDDFVREPYHPRDLIINDSTICFVSNITVTSKIGNHSVPVNTEDEEHPSELPIEPFVDNGNRNVLLALLNNIASLTKPIKSLVTAAWILVGVVAYFLLFKK